MGASPASPHAAQLASPAKSPKPSPWAALKARLCDESDEESEELQREQQLKPELAAAAQQPAQEAPGPGGKAGSALQPQSPKRHRGPQLTLRDTLRSLINKLKLVMPALKGVETPNDTTALVSLVDKLFGKALKAEAQVRRHSCSHLCCMPQSCWRAAAKT